MGKSFYFSIMPTSSFLHLVSGVTFFLHLFLNHSLLAVFLVPAEGRVNTQKRPVPVLGGLLDTVFVGLGNLVVVGVILYTYNKELVSGVILNRAAAYKRKTGI